LGHLALQYAKIAGAQVVTVDLVDERLETAKEHGTMGAPRLVVDFSDGV
jgi:D-arabinose 1-dehydrogenase-like Zn-dependent alcohol dehydrogenase